MHRWLPVSVSTSDNQVVWLDFGETRPSEPLFRQTLRRLAGAPSYYSDLEFLMRSTHPLPDLRVAGLIFHVSRCGSTLVSNGMHSDDVLVMSEALPLSQVLPPFESRPAILRSVLRKYGEVCRTTSVVIKCNPSQSLHIDRIRQLWPNAPAIAIVRDPAEVLVSCLALQATVPAMTSERLGEIYRAVSISGLPVLHYEDIRLETLQKVAGLFQVPLGESDLSLHAKSVDGARFSPDSESKRKAMTPQLQSEVDRWIQPHYESLMANAEFLR